MAPVDLTLTSLALATMAGVPSMLDRLLRSRRERRALEAYERCRAPDADAGADITDIIAAFHPPGVPPLTHAIPTALGAIRSARSTDLSGTRPEFRPR